MSFWKMWRLISAMITCTLVNLIEESCRAFESLYLEEMRILRRNKKILLCDKSEAEYHTY
ncbi:hypothetical protein ACP275_07G086600 [Erythranthe tilingii]